MPGIVQTLRDFGCEVPIVGDFHYNGHILLKQYPDCAKALAKYRINPGNVKHRQAARRQLPHDDRGRDRARQARADRRELGLAGPAAADQPDGRERQARETPERSRGDVRNDRAERAAVRRSGRGLRTRARPHHPERKGLRRAGPDRGLPRLGAALRLPPAPRPDRGWNGQQGRGWRPLPAWRCCCRRGSETPFGCR